MGGVPTPLAYLFMSWGAITAVLLILVIYGNTLSIREDGRTLPEQVRGPHDGRRAEDPHRENGSAEAGHRRPCDSVRNLAGGECGSMGVDWSLSILAS
jgi:hypothetical protein